MWLFGKKEVVGVKDKDGDTRLHRAIYKSIEGDMPDAEDYWNKRNLPDKLGRSNRYGFKQIEAEIRERMEALINQGEDVNAQNNKGETILHRAAEFATGVKILIARRANVNLADNKGWTPLHWAAQNKWQSAVFQFLVEAGANPNAVTEAGEHVLDIAIGRGITSTVKYLLTIAAVKNHPNVGATLAANNNRLLRQAVKDGDLDFAKLLLSFPEVMANVMPPQKEVLSYAGTSSFAKYLLTIPAVKNHPKLGAILAQLDNRFLREAAGEGDLTFVNFLLSFPEVMSNVTACENGALRAAQESNKAQAVVIRLMEIQTVKYYGQVKTLLYAAPTHKPKLADIEQPQRISERLKGKARKAI